MSASRPNEAFQHLQNYNFSNLDEKISVEITEENGKRKDPVEAADLFLLEEAVIFVQPGASTADEAKNWLPKNWAEIKGAGGCGPQVVGIRDNLEQFGSRKIFVLNTKLNHETIIQEKNLKGVTFVHATPELIEALKLPTFTAIDPRTEKEKTYLSRVTLIVNRGIITQIIRADTPAESAKETLCELEKAKQAASTYSPTNSAMYRVANQSDKDKPDEPSAHAVCNHRFGH